MPAMTKSVPLMIGLRYIRAKRRNAFISFVSLFAFAGMALGVLALIVVLSVMNGFDHELKQRILRVVPHGFIYSNSPLDDLQSLADTIQETPHLTGSAPFISGFGLVEFRGRVKGIQIDGIDPAVEPAVSEVAQYMLLGELQQDLTPGDYHVALGSLLARYLRVTVGDKISITMPSVSVTPAGVFPRTRRFTVAAVFEVGAQIDQSLALVNIQDAQKLFRRGDKIDGLRLRFDNLYNAPAGVKSLAQNLASAGARPITTKDWSQTQGSLFHAVKMEKTMVGVMLSIIVAVAAFNIVTSLIMMIAEKRSDIAVLRTMGLPASGVVKIFLAQGVTIGVVGIAVGAIAGILIALNLSAIVSWIEWLFQAQIFDPTVYFVSVMPSQLQWPDVIKVCVGALVISMLATCYPAWKASRITPAEALRYNI